MCLCAGFAAAWPAQCTLERISVEDLVLLGCSLAALPPLSLCVYLRGTVVASTVRTSAYCL